MLNHEERILHYKMYKAKKQWLFAGMGVLLMSSALMMGSGVTARADGTSQTGTSTTQVQADGSTSTATDPAAAQQALDAYTKYKTGGYQDAVNQFQQDSQTLNAAKSQYNDQKTTYDNELTQYQTQVKTQAPENEDDNPVTSNPTTKAQLDGTYDSVNQDYEALKDQPKTINGQIGTANQNLKDAQDQLTTLYNQLPDSVKTAGDKVAEYNANTQTAAAKLVADSTAQAYSKALTVYPAGLTKMIQDVQSLADNSPVKVSAKTDATTNGSVSATLYGQTYQDKNGDGKITYEDDVLPAAIADLTNDLSKAQSGQTNFAGSYPEIIALFTYLKQVGDTALPYQTEDGTTGRIESGLASAASTALSTNGSLTAGYLSTTYATSLLQTIEGTKASAESTVKGIWDSTGLPFDQAGFDQKFDDTLKKQAILIYKQQTDKLLNTAQTVLAAFKQADKDPLWVADAPGVVYYPTKDLTSRLQTTLDSLQQQITEGTAALAQVPASDNFLSIAYSQGAASGFTQDLTINSLWNTLYHNAIDAYGMSVSPLMKTVMPNAAKSDPDTKTETITTPKSGQTITNTIYSPKFIADHQAIFDAATTLSDAVTDLTVQSAEVASNFKDVLTELLKIPDQFNTDLPDFSQTQTIKSLTEAESKLGAPQQVKLVPVKLMLNYMDGDTRVGSNTELIYSKDGTVTWTADAVPANYQLADDQLPTGSTEFGTNTAVTVTIKLAHQHAKSTMTQKVVTNFVASDGVQAAALPKTDTQQITWTVDQDKVTNDWTATPDKTSTDAVSAPVINVDSTTAYVPDVYSVNGETADVKTGTGTPATNLPDITRTVTYHEAKLSGEDTLPVQKTTTVVQNVKTNFMAVSPDMNATVLPSDVTQQITWTVVYDSTTGTWTATPDTLKTDPVTASAIQVDGTIAYVPDISSVAGVTVAPFSGTTDPTSTIENATDPRTITYYKAVLPTDGVQDKVATTTVVQNVTTKFAPAQGSGVDATKLPVDDIQTITWTVVHDFTKGTWTATPSSTGTDAVKAPVIQIDSTTAYVPSVNSVAGVTTVPISGTDDPTAQLADATRTVTYFAAQLPATGIEIANGGVVPDTAPSAKSYPVQYVDDSGTVVGTGDFVGNPGDIVNAKVPAGYTLTQGQTDSQTIGENTTTIIFRVTMPSSSAGEVVTPGDGEQTVVPDGDNGGEPAGDNEVETDAGGAVAVTEGTDGQTSGTAETTQIGQITNGGQATGTSQTASAGTVTQNSGQAGTVVGTTTDAQQGAAAKGQLPQTNETNENAAVGLGVLGLSLLMSVLGLKKRKRD